MVGKQSLVVTAGSEMEYLTRQGLTFEEIPGVCLDGKNFIRSMDCDAELAKMGITLPTPTDTGGIPKECMIDEKTAVSPQECQGRLKKKIIIDTMPKECQDANVLSPEDCSKVMEEKRISEGIGINMPSECVGISVEECKTIMEQKGIKVEKIEQVQKVEKIEKAEQVQKMCKEGEVCENNAEYEEVTLPKECIEMGVSDVKDCGMVAGKINEERIKNGEKITIDEKGKVDYINPEQIEKIADDSEKAAQDVKPDFEKAEEMKQEINNLEKDMNKITEEQPSDKGNDMVEGGSSGGNSGSSNSGSGESGGNVVVSGGDAGANNNVVDSGGASGGESVAVTGGL